MADDTDKNLPGLAPTDRYHSRRRRLGRVRVDRDRDVSEKDGPGIPIVMYGATVITVDGDGLVTSWRDYLDTNEPMGQIKAGLEA